MNKKILQYIAIVGLNLGVAIFSAQAANQEYTCQNACNPTLTLEEAARRVKIFCNDYHSIPAHHVPI